MYDEEGAPALDGKLKLYGFNNLTKALSFNIYDICYAKSAREQRDYIKYIDEQYNSDRLTKILSQVTDMIGARILNIAKQDYEPQGASVTMLIAEEAAVISGSKKPINGTALTGETILAHLDKSHVTVHTYPEFHPDTSIATFRVDIDVATCGEITPLQTLDYLISQFDSVGLKKAEWIASHVCFYSLSRIMNDLSSFAPPRTRERLTEVYYEKFARFMPSHPYHKSILHVAAALQLKPGRKYIDYLVPDERGRDVMLSSLYQGKLIYINLWASWCGSCRRHAKSLIPLYNKYKDRGFQIISFARESRKGAMEEAEERDGYPWKSQAELNDRHQIWLRNGLGNAGGGGYLIDNNGTILAVYPSADELEAILKQRL